MGVLITRWAHFTTQGESNLAQESKKDKLEGFPTNLNHVGRAYSALQSLQGILCLSRLDAETATFLFVQIPRHAFL